MPQPRCSTGNYGQSMLTDDGKLLRLDSMTTWAIAIHSKHLKRIVGYLALARASQAALSCICSLCGADIDINAWQHHRAIPL